jgi:hypothetical protein
LEVWIRTGGEKLLGCSSTSQTKNCGKR